MIDRALENSGNVMVCSFTPVPLKGIIFLSGEMMVAADQGTNYGPELSTLANSLKKGFGNDETSFYYTIPSKVLAPKLTQPKASKVKTPV